MALVLSVLLSSAQAGVIAERDMADLTGYLERLDAGGALEAATVNRLADMEYAGLELTMRHYAALPADADPATDRAYLALMERISRSALLPWPMLELYAPQYGAFMVESRQPELAAAVYARLKQSEAPRVPMELAVRLTPALTFADMTGADGTEALATELYQAWNRRYARGEETRPFAAARLEQRAALISLPAAEHGDDFLEAQLRFVAALAPDDDAAETVYHERLLAWLTSGRADRVQAALEVQRDYPAALQANRALVETFRADTAIVSAAIMNYGFDDSQDHAAVLREIWRSLGTDEVRYRHACLFSMSVHPAGNSGIIIDAVRERPEEYLDMALEVLMTGEAAQVTELLQAILMGKWAHEPALRLAREMKLPGLEARALELLAGSKDLIVRNAALQYLGTAPGPWRRQLLPYLKTPDTDIRLATVMALAEPGGLTAEDRELIGPALSQVALKDPNPGIRQEALYSLGKWRAASATPLFTKFRTENAAAAALDGDLLEAQYWPHRFWLVASLSLAKLGDDPSRADLDRLARSQDPALQMEGLLAWESIGEVHPAAWEALGHTEPKLVATAAHLIASHGDAPAKRRLRGHFAARPMWQLFAVGGIDDHLILEYAGLASHGQHGHDH